MKSVAEHLAQQRALAAGPGLFSDHNKVGGYMCTSCAWAKPAKPHLGEFCENGAKATFWDLTPKRTTREFFAAHTVSELLGWSDYDLENEGRVTEPMRYDPAQDRYVPIAWDDAFAAIGTKLKALEPKSVVFYASGRASLETSYMYQLLARLYGNNNLPDSFNMCHETPSVALPQSIGVPVGTGRLDEFDHTDCIFSFGQNVGTNSPRLLPVLQKVRERNVPIVVFNPLRERGWEACVNPQQPLANGHQSPSEIATQYLQVHGAGDIAAMMGIAKALLAFEAEAEAGRRPPVLDRAFIAEHTHGFEAFETQVHATAWTDIIEASGLPHDALEKVAETFSRAKNIVAIYGRG